MPTLDIVIPSFNSGTSLHRTLDGVLRQNFGGNWQVKVIAVDDASTDNSFASLPQETLEAIYIIRLEQNKGRSIARNAGANSSTSDYILFLDSDCEPESQNSFQLLIDSLDNGFDVIYASVKAKGSGFWVDYFNEISSNREKVAKSGNLHGFSSQYFVVSRRCFEVCGGFDESYLTYGFEDRDLIFRLRDTGAKIGFAPKSVVFHEEVTSIFTVTSKLKEAGQFSSVIFERSHPDVYRKMKYGRIDARLHPILIRPIVLLLLSPAHQKIFRYSDKLLRSKLAPASTKKIVVKCISALAYSIGTLKAQSTL